MHLCGSRSALQQKQDQVDREHAELEAEAERLARALQESEALLPGLSEELAAAEEWERQECDEAELAEERRYLFQEELDEQLAEDPEEGVPFAESAAAGDAGPGGSLAEGHAEEEAQLLQRIEHHEGELQRFESGDAGQLRALQEAEAVAAEMNAEVAELRAALVAAEEEGRILVTEQAAAEEESSPLHDWVNHVGTQLKLARAENSELSASLALALQSKTDLERDQLEAHAWRPSDKEVSALCWMEEHERSGALRRASLTEEIAEQKTRRKTLLVEVRRCRQKAAVADQQQQRQQPQPQQLGAGSPAPCTPGAANTEEMGLGVGNVQPGPGRPSPASAAAASGGLGLSGLLRSGAVASAKRRSAAPRPPATSSSSEDEDIEFA